MIDLQRLVRPNILKLSTGFHAESETDGQPCRIALDANENPYNKPFNRYPSDCQRELKAQLAKLKRVADNEIFLGNGSTEAIDLCYRIFCQPRIDNVVAIDPPADCTDSSQLSMTLNTGLFRYPTISSWMLHNCSRPVTDIRSWYGSARPIHRAGIHLTRKK